MRFMYPSSSLAKRAGISDLSPQCLSAGILQRYPIIMVYKKKVPLYDVTNGKCRASFQYPSTLSMILHQLLRKRYFANNFPLPSRPVQQLKKIRENIIAIKRKKKMSETARKMTPASASRPRRVTSQKHGFTHDYSTYLVAGMFWLSNTYSVLSSIILIF